MKRSYPGILTACAVLLLLGCQKDDICPESDETTPLLQIEFFDADDPETLKVVQGLLIIDEASQDTLLGPTTTNNIQIPLRTDQSFTEYLFVRSSGTETENSDRIRFDYLPTPDYVNRACGFKINFMDLTLRRDPGDNWIVSHIENIDNIENEAATHISITH